MRSWHKLPMCVAAAVPLLGANAPGSYQIDLTHYFSSPVEEEHDRVDLAPDVDAFVASSTPRTPQALVRWLQRYDALLKVLQRHDIYVYLRSEENDADTVDAKAGASLDDLEDRLSGRVVQAAKDLGAADIAKLAQASSVAPYRYLLEASLARSAHQLSAVDLHVVDLAVTPVLDTAAASYKAMRKSPGSVASHQDAYAALLISIATARNGVARLRGFSGAAQAAYFDRDISADSVERTLAAIRASTAYARYRSVAQHAPKDGFAPPVMSIGDAIPVILAAEQSMGTEYAAAYASLLNQENHRLEICTASSCDDAGFSVGFAGVESGVYYGDFHGHVNEIRAVAHESGHAVHREFMSRNQPVAAYNEGPHFMFESFAIFNELLFLDHLYQTATTNAQRAFYLDAFLDDATFQVFGSAEETDLESSIYRGVDDRTIRTATDLRALTSKVFARYDPTSSSDADIPLYWAHDRLFFTDPLYDVNYLYAGLLALQYFADFQRSPATFSNNYVALLKNGFNDTPAALEHRFLGIDLTDENALVVHATTLIDTRTTALARLYGKGTPFNSSSTSRRI